MWRSVAPVKAPSHDRTGSIHEIVGDGAAIDRDEGLRLAFAGAMDGAGEQFLADAGLALDQHRNAGSCRLLRGAQHGRHGFAAGDDVGKGQPAFAAMADALQFALERRGVERVAQRHLQPFEADRLDHEILRAGAHRRNHIVDAAMGGLHDDGDAQACFTHFCEHAEPVEAGHHEVEHDRVDRLRIRSGQQGHGRIAAVDDEGLIAALLHHVFNQTAPRSSSAIKMVAAMALPARY